MNEYEEKVKILAQYIEEAQNITVLTGAGISTESGIPDFRSTDGFWTKNKSREELMSRNFFNQNPNVFWEAYKDIFKIKLINNFEPNFGHQFLVELEKMGKNVTIITQNVDGLHEKAGSSKVYESHGSIKTASCTKCKTEYDLSHLNQSIKCGKNIVKENVCNNYIVFKQSDKNYGYTYCESCKTKHPIDSNKDSMRCKGIKKTILSCNGYLKPGVVLFGDSVKFFKEGKESTLKSDLFLVLGSSLQVGPINELALIAQEENKDRVSIIINNDETIFDGLFDEVIHHSIGDTFNDVAITLKERLNQ